MYLQFMSTGDKHFSHLRTHFIWKMAAALLVVRPRRRRRKFQTQGEMAAERGQLRDTTGASLSSANSDPEFQSRQRRADFHINTKIFVFIR
jgi:hypothetical protein